MAPNEHAVDANNEKAIDNANVMTSACLVDRLKQNLAIVKGTNGKYDDRKYYNEAHEMLKIGAFKPAPHFIIYLTDLSRELIIELHRLDARDRLFVLKQAVGRIFEDVNFDIYHNSVSQVLKVKLMK